MPGDETNDARITVDPGRMGGVPCIGRSRIPVATVQAMVVGGMTTGEVVQALPALEPEDVEAALRYRLPGEGEPPGPGGLPGEGELGGGGANGATR